MSSYPQLSWQVGYRYGVTALILLETPSDRQADLGCCLPTSHTPWLTLAMGRTVGGLLGSQDSHGQTRLHTLYCEPYPCPVNELSVSPVSPYPVIHVL